MTLRNLFLAMSLLTVVACDEGAAEGEECEETADCADGLECHEHDGVKECESEDHDEDEE
ncbi:MAG: hypothetical protein AAFV53_35680 [Myxococcota bacterium]